MKNLEWLKSFSLCSVKHGMTFLIVSFVYIQMVEATVWSGGVGVQERLAAPTSGMKFVLARNTGEYLAYCDITIKDASQNVVSMLRSNGPWVVANLKPGNYRLTAKRIETGEQQGVSFSVEDKNLFETFYLVFKDTEIKDN